MSDVFARLAGAPVLAGTVRLPLYGRWVARLEVDADAAPSGPVALSLGAGALSLAGAVYAGEARYGRWRGVVVGGRGGLHRELPGRDYRNVPARLVAEGALAEAGEALSPASGAELAKPLPRWVRCAGPAVAAFEGVLEPLGLGWRVVPDGTVWAGTESWPASKATGDLLDVGGSGLCRAYALDAPLLLPGETFDGARVGLVVHTLTGGASRTNVWLH
ncbi:MAG TPA: hypothetical protein VFS43_00680 [Polyangiaceae bacterium]|nr:hypothetical protein [Polyangiaceae bacterium]